MSAITVRRALATDVPAIAGIHVRSWQAAYRGILPDELLDQLSASEREGRWRELLGEGDDRWLVMVAEDSSGEPVGFCATATPSRDADAGAATAEVAAIYVDPDRWRQGAGSALLAATLAELAERGFRETVLWVLPENRSAMAFYRRFGFAVEEGSEKLEERSGHRVARLRASLPGDGP